MIMVTDSAKELKRFLVLTSPSEYRPPNEISTKQGNFNTCASGYDTNRQTDPPPDTGNVCQLLVSWVDGEPS